MLLCGKMYFRSPGHEIREQTTVLSFGIIRCINFKPVRVENCFPWLTFPSLRFLFRLAYRTTVSVVVSEDRNVAGRKLEWFYLSF